MRFKTFVTKSFFTETVFWSWEQKRGLPPEIDYFEYTSKKEVKVPFMSGVINVWYFMLTIIVMILRTKAKNKVLFCPSKRPRQPKSFLLLKTEVKGAVKGIKGTNHSFCYETIWENPSLACVSELWYHCLHHQSMIVIIVITIIITYSDKKWKDTTHEIMRPKSFTKRIEMASFPVFSHSLNV